MIELEEVIAGAAASGRVTVLAGAMRCPNEDGGGNKVYQTEVLEPLCRLESCPEDTSARAELRSACAKRAMVLK